MESKNKIFAMIFFLCIVSLTGKIIAQDTVSHTLTVLSSDINLGTVRSYSTVGKIITITPNNTSASFSGTADLIAIPQAGKVFVGWSDDVLNNPRTVTVGQDMTFTAIFKDCETANIEGITDSMVTYFKFSPNPVIDYLMVELDVSAIGGVLEIWDRWGRMVIQQVVSSQMEIISMQHLADGIYYLRLLSYDGKTLDVASITKWHN